MRMHYALPIAPAGVLVYFRNIRSYLLPSIANHTRLTAVVSIVLCPYLPVYMSLCLFCLVCIPWFSRPQTHPTIAPTNLHSRDFSTTNSKRIACVVYVEVRVYKSTAVVDLTHRFPLTGFFVEIIPSLQDGSRLGGGVLQPHTQPPRPARGDALFLC